MRKVILPAIIFAALLGNVSGQDLTGSWQGTLTAGRDLRTVFKITKADGALRGVFYSIDQSGQGLPVSPITLQGTAVKMTIPGLGGTYEGKLSADANTIEGNWTQPGPPPTPLVLKRATAETAWVIPPPPAPTKPMAADANPVFEVATIKPSNPDAPGKGFQVRGRQFSTLNTTVSDLVTFAYGIHARQVTNIPAWFETDKFDLSAKPDGEGQPNDKQWKTMIQKLLADRFKLTFHHDKKELSVYTLVLAKGGPKLTKSEGDPNGLPALFFRGLGMLPARNATMADFAGLLQGAVLDRPVVDQTGLAGRWDFTLNWTPDESQFAGLGVRVPPPTDSASAPPGLFAAVQEQLGLKLDATKAPVDVLVVDRVEKPSEN
jgi:uncharacterized protein (TIGR03435 family)